MVWLWLDFIPNGGPRSPSHPCTLHVGFRSQANGPVTIRLAISLSATTTFGLESTVKAGWCKHDASALQ